MKADKASQRRPWTESEDALLIGLVENSTTMSWTDIVKAAFPTGDRSALDCQARWEGLRKPKPQKGPWTPEEDAKLLTLIQAYGSEKWVVIAYNMGTRSGKQCRERWHNHLDPKIKKTVWTDTEVATLNRLYAEMGPRWAEIAKHLPGRPDNTIKNFWNTSTGRHKRSRGASMSSIPAATTKESPVAMTRSQSNVGSRFSPYNRSGALGRPGDDTPPGDLSPEAQTAPVDPRIVKLTSPPLVRSRSHTLAVTGQPSGSQMHRKSSLYDNREDVARLRALHTAPRYLAANPHSPLNPSPLTPDPSPNSMISPNDTEYSSNSSYPWSPVHPDSRSLLSGASDESHRNPPYHTTSWLPSSQSCGLGLDVAALGSELLEEEDASGHHHPGFHVYRPNPSPSADTFGAAAHHGSNPLALYPASPDARPVIPPLRVQIGPPGNGGRRILTRHSFPELTSNRPASLTGRWTQLPSLHEHSGHNAPAEPQDGARGLHDGSSLARQGSASSDLHSSAFDGFSGSSSASSSFLSRTSSVGTSLNDSPVFYRAHSDLPASFVKQYSFPATSPLTSMPALVSPSQSSLSRFSTSSDVDSGVRMSVSTSSSFGTDAGRWDDDDDDDEFVGGPSSSHFDYYQQAEADLQALHLTSPVSFQQGGAVFPTPPSSYTHTPTFTHAHPALHVPSRSFAQPPSLPYSGAHPHSSFHAPYAHRHSHSASSADDFAPPAAYAITIAPGQVDPPSFSTPTASSYGNESYGTEPYGLSSSGDMRSARHPSVDLMAVNAHGSARLPSASVMF